MAYEEDQGAAPCGTSSLETEGPLVQWANSLSANDVHDLAAAATGYPDDRDNGYDPSDGFWGECSGLTESVSTFCIVPIH